MQSAAHSITNTTKSLRGLSYCWKVVSFTTACDAIFKWSSSRYVTVVPKAQRRNLFRVTISHSKDVFFAVCACDDLQQPPGEQSTCRLRSFLPDRANQEIWYLSELIAIFRKNWSSLGVQMIVSSWSYNPHSTCSTGIRNISLVFAVACLILTTRRFAWALSFSVNAYDT